MLKLRIKLGYRHGEPKPTRNVRRQWNSSFQRNKYSAISFGIDYKIKKNLLTYFEITQYKFKSDQLNIFDLSSQIKVANLTQKIQDNNGKVFLTGIYYLF